MEIILDHHAHYYLQVLHKYILRLDMMEQLYPIGYSFLSHMDLLLGILNTNLP
ncbi:hypothetical protein [Pedobacter sp. WC2423]|uniref:hypothetical protein n=1 Tax=Pedobacter sp. WC2423 TaxID=3234142 RepID=UPI0034655242